MWREEGRENKTGAAEGRRERREIGGRPRRRDTDRITSRVANPIIHLFAETIKICQGYRTSFANEGLVGEGND